ncbi:ABC transporter permease [Mycoplasmopsis synoviae]|uniref:ABC transporter permease n=1 Tax=Mycoplasmopsis synoviae TaxID=2109 RepID=UPI0034DB0F2C
MIKYLTQRVLLAIFTIFAIAIIVFFLVAYFAENPFVKEWENSGFKAEQAESVFQRSKDTYLIKPDTEFSRFEPLAWIDKKESVFVRFGYWVKSVFDSNQPFGFVFNQNILSNADVKTIPAYFFRFLPYSLIITLPSFLISASLGIFLGIIAGYKRGKFFDWIVNLLSQFFVALPIFVTASVVILVLLSVFGTPPLFLLPRDIEINGLSNTIASWASPIFVVVIGSLAGYITFVRNQVVTVLTSNYVLIAKSKGLNQRQIFFKYVLRNISIPLAATLIPSYIGLLSGGVVIETYWRVPGVSNVIVNAFPNGEINIIMFSTVFFTTLSVFTTIIVDISFVFLDPRIRYYSSSTSLLFLFKQYLVRNKEKKLEQAKN